MNAKVLISYYRDEGGYAIHRVYLEPHFEQAEADLEMIQDNGLSSKQWELLETDVYAWSNVVENIGKSSKTKNNDND